MQPASSWTHVGFVAEANLCKATQAAFAGMHDCMQIALKKVAMSSDLIWVL